MNDDSGYPCTNSTAGAPGSPASRYAIPAASATGSRSHTCIERGRVGYGFSESRRREGKANGREPGRGSGTGARGRAGASRSERSRGRGQVRGVAKGAGEGRGAPGGPRADGGDRGGPAREARGLARRLGQVRDLRRRRGGSLVRGGPRGQARPVVTAPSRGRRRGDRGRGGRRRGEVQG